MKLEIINESHNTNFFDCGNIDINNFLKNNALIDTQSFVSKTFVLKKKETNKIIGFYTLISSQLSKSEGSFIISREHKYKVPAVLFGQLGVDKNFSGQGIGTNLLIKAIEDILKVCKIIGFAAIVVDAANENLIKFYEERGFKKLPNKDRKLFLSMSEATLTFKKQVIYE